MTQLIDLLQSSEPGHPYITRLTTPGDPHTVLLEAAATWLEERFGTPALVHGLEITRDHRTLHVTRDGTLLEIAMTEVAPNGVWRTVLRAQRDSRGAGEIQTLVLGMTPDESRSQWVATPRIAGTLLDRGDMRLGTMAVRRHAPLLAPDDVAELVWHLGDPDRSAPIVLARAASGDPMTDRFWGMVEAVTAGVRGMAAVYRLDDAAHARLAELVDPAWLTPVWTLRTYVPHLDLARVSRARSCRILGQERLAMSEDRQLAGLLSRGVRAVSWDVNAVAAALTGSEVERALATLLRRESAPARPAVAPARPGADSELERVRVALGLDDLTEESLLALVEAATAPRLSPAEADHLSERVRSLADLNSDLLERAEFAELLLVEAEEDALALREENDRLQRRAAWLQANLSDPSRVAEYVDEGSLLPRSFEELAGRLPALAEAGVVFTGDLARMHELEDLDAGGVVLRTTWDVLQMCVAYVAAYGAGEFTGSMSRFVTDPVGVAPMPASCHVPTETGPTMDKYGRLRRFPVPVSVNDRGWVEMKSHFRLGRIPGHQDARMHYEDQTGGDGNIYVGYIGTHLPTVSTDRRKLR